MRRYALRDDQWDRIKDFLPGREGHVGGTAEDNRLFVEAVLYRYRTGCPWRDVPERFGTIRLFGHVIPHRPHGNELPGADELLGSCWLFHVWLPPPGDESPAALSVFENHFEHPISTVTWEQIAGRSG